MSCGLQRFRREDKGRGTRSLTRNEVVNLAADAANQLHDTGIMHALDGVLLFDKLAQL